LFRSNPTSSTGGSEALAAQVVLDVLPRRVIKKSGQQMGVLKVNGKPHMKSHENPHEINKTPHEII